jgi:hypothetical protein
MGEIETGTNLLFSRFTTTAPNSKKMDEQQKRESELQNHSPIFSTPHFTDFSRGCTTPADNGAPAPGAKWSEPPTAH